jgi:hypothetical protein
MQTGGAGPGYRLSSSPSSYVLGAAAGVAWWREGAAAAGVHEPAQARGRGQRLLETWASALSQIDLVHDDQISRIV